MVIGWRRATPEELRHLDLEDEVRDIKRALTRLASLLGCEPGVAVEAACQTLASRATTIRRQNLELAEHQAKIDRLRQDQLRLRALQTVRPEHEWHEDLGPALWWFFPIEEEPYVGGPLDTDWPGYHTHWSPLPRVLEPAGIQEGER